MTADELRSRLDALGGREVLLTQVDVRIDVREAPSSLAPPTVPNTWTARGTREWLWLGPDEWLVTADTEGSDEVLAELRAALAGSHHSLVDVSASRWVLELADADRLERLSAGCGLDLHPRSWRAGMCAQTLLARVPVILQERERDTRVFVRPSVSGYLVSWLVATAADPGPG